MERYIVRKSQIVYQGNHRIWVAYDNDPASAEFTNDLSNNNANLLRLKCSGPFDFKFYLHLRKIIRQNQINVIHAYFTPTCHYIMIAAFFFGIKKRFRSSANLPLTLFRKSGKGSLLSEKAYMVRQYFLSLFSNKIICRSESIKQEFSEMGVSGRKLAVASGGTDTDRYCKNRNLGKSVRADLGISEETFVIGTACRLVPVKNLKTLLHAVPLLLNKQKNKKFLLLVAGNGPDYGSLQELINELAIGNTVKLLGHRDDLPHLLNALDVFVLPSWSEGMSNSILEALACEVPVVVSDIPPNLEILAKAHDEKLVIGKVFQPDNKEMLAEKLCDMIESDNLPEIGRNGRYIVEKFFSLDARIEKEFSIYEGQV
jgi:glycosyltransferase involved in cell wall biosynthesis